MGWLSERRDRRRKFEEAKDEGTVASVREAWLDHESDLDARAAYQEVLGRHIRAGHGWRRELMFEAAFHAYDLSFKHQHGDPVPERFQHKGLLATVYIGDDVHKMLHRENPAWVQGDIDGFKDLYSSAAATTTLTGMRFQFADKDTAKQALERMRRSFLGG